MFESASFSQSTETPRTSTRPTWAFHVLLYIVAGCQALILANIATPARIIGLAEAESLSAPTEMFESNNETRS